jgi:hypothetical protein
MTSLEKNQTKKPRLLMLLAKHHLFCPMQAFYHWATPSAPIIYLGSLFPNTGYKLNINSHFPFSSLKSQTKYMPPKQSLETWTQTRWDLLSYNTYCVRTAEWLGFQDKDKFGSPTECFLLGQPSWSHDNIGGLHLKINRTNASAWTLTFRENC